MRKISLLTALVLLFVCRLAHADVHVHPSVNVSETYDSNINQVHTDPTSDYITKLTFGLAATYEGKLDTMQLNGAVSRNIYASNSAFDNTDESLNLSLNHEFDRFDRMSASENFIHSQDPQTFEDAFGRKQGIYAYYRNDLSLAYTHDFTSQLSVTGTLANELYNDSRAGQPDSVQNTLTLDCSYALSSATSGLLEYSYNKRDYNPGAYISSNSVMAGLRQYLTKQVYIQGMAGEDFVRNYDGKSTTDPVYELSLVDTMTDAVTGTLTLTKSDSATSYSQDTFKNWRFSADLSRQFSERLRLGLNAFYGEGKYTLEGVKETLEGASIRLGYDILRDVTFNLSFSYTNQSSNFTSNQYSREVVTAGVNIKF